MATETRTGLIA